tara:strand:- start:275 stop:475 length:201 start_codon:yes stop_codon:yes gene_type:complete
MALSKSVEESLTEAEASLRNALAYAARQERPIICNSISELLCKISTIRSYDDMIDTLEQLKSNEEE